MQNDQLKALNWHFDQAINVVRNNRAAAIIVSSEHRAYGPYLASIPGTTRMARQLLSVFEESNVAWEGEEDSVQQEHADYISEALLRAKDLDGVLYGSTPNGTTELVRRHAGKMKNVPTTWVYVRESGGIFNVGNAGIMSSHQKPIKIGSIFESQPEKQDEIGRLIDMAPIVIAASHELIELVQEAVSVWEDEEDSVQEEHYNLISRMKATAAFAHHQLTGTLLDVSPKFTAVYASGMYLEMSDDDSGCFTINLNTEMSGIDSVEGAGDDVIYTTRTKALNAAQNILQDWERRQEEGPAVSEESDNSESPAP